MQSATEAILTVAPRERRVRVVGDRVACHRIGPTDVGRCAECVYRLRIGRHSVVCLEGDPSDDTEFAW